MKFLLSAAFITVLTVGYLLPHAAYAARTEAEKVVLKPLRDLDFGHSLYFLFQQEYLPAIVQLTVAQEKQTIPHHIEDSQLLLGGMYLSFGMHREAGEMFDRLINKDVPLRVRNRAWFYLAKIRYQRELYPEAENAILKIEDTLPGEMERERQLLLANILMAQQRYVDADAHLTAIKDTSIWSSYARYNLAVSLVKQENFTRGEEILKQLGSSLAPDKEAQAIRDQANLALGYTYIQQQKPQPAIEYLRKVRLKGHLSNKALLGLGWAYDQQEEYTRALAPWLELNKRNILDSAVQESLLATPYALSKLDKDARALEHYQNAIEIYGSEIQRLEKAIINISSGSFIQNILEKQSSNEMGWFWEMEDAPDSAESDYLLTLLASHSFQESLKNYRDLRILRKNMEQWAYDIDVFDTILETRRIAYANRLPDIQKTIEQINSNVLQQKRDQYDSELKRIELTDDLLALANDKEKGQLQILSRVDAGIKKVSTQRSMTSAEEKLRLLKGVLKWDIASQYGPRIWSVKNNLKQLDEALTLNRERSQSMINAEKQAPQRFEGYGARIDQSRIQVNDLIQMINRTQLAQQKLLESMAIGQLRNQQRRIESYLTHAQFSVAQIQDKASHRQEEVAP